MLLEQLKERLEADQKKARSAWEKGVFSYAVEMVEGVQNDQIMSQEKDAEKHDASDYLNHVGARGIKIDQFWTVDERIKLNKLAHDCSWGGIFEIMNENIVDRLCTPGEKKRFSNGKMQIGPSPKKQWPDVQGSAVYSALVKIHDILRNG